MISREKLEREKCLEKKRKISREREKSQKKREYFHERFFSRENSLFTFLSTSNASLLLQTLLKVLTLPMLPFSCLFTFFQEDLEKNS